MTLRTVDVMKPSLPEGGTATVHKARPHVGRSSRRLLSPRMGMAEKGILKSTPRTTEQESPRIG